MTKLTRCSPHWWKVPKVGDDGLTCTECDRFLKFERFDPRGNICASIRRAVDRLRAPDEAQAFEDALVAAKMDWDARKQKAYCDQPEVKARMALYERSRNMPRGRLF